MEQLQQTPTSLRLNILQNVKVNICNTCLTVIHILVNQPNRYLNDMVNGISFHFASIY